MKEVAQKLVKWYQQNKRELPWRKDKNPYHVWISEIMLQQTRIEAVKNYYTRFMTSFPNIHALATAKEEQVLKLWEGLGYYNRARNLQKAAQIIEEQYGGKFPTQYEEILSLPGIGEYTAGAIASICFNEKAVAVDGNVLRVYMRLTNCQGNVLEPKVKKRVSLELMKILPDDSGDFNEGLMELGEIICLPTTPLCEQCPIQRYCKAYQQQTQTSLPTRIKKENKKEENLTVFLLYYQQNIALSYRDQQTLLKNLWQFPNVEKTMDQEAILSWLKMQNVEGNIQGKIQNRHVFTHKIWNMTGYLIAVDNMIPTYTWVSLEEAREKYTIPTAFQPFLNYLEEVIK